MSSEDFDGRIIEPLDLGGKPFTARAIMDWYDCPMKFMLSHFVSRAESRRFIGGAAALHQAVRDSLIECYRRGGPGEVAAEALEGIFAERWDGSLCADSLEEERLAARGRKMLAEYHARRADEPCEVIATDERLEMEADGHGFVAVADVVLREGDGGLNALRWLTTRKPPGLEELAQSTSWALLFMAARERWPDEDLSVTMYSLRRQAGHRIRYEEHQLKPLLRRLTRAAGRIRVATEFPARTGPQCRWCRARARCPALK
jgi:hypothetical protein